MRMLKRYVRIPGHEGGTCYRGKNGKLASDKSVVKKKGVPVFGASNPFPVKTKGRAKNGSFPST